jgi:bacterial/archaeal transporter family-2 protein
VSASSLAASFAFAAGLAVALQAAMNSALGKRIGIPETVLLAGLVTTVLVGAVVLALRGGTGSLGDLGRAPAWTWLGGLMGTIALVAISYAPAKIGVFGTLALFLGGQLAMALVVDTLGLLETPRTTLTLSRVAGVLLVIAGAALVLRR